MDDPYINFQHQIVTLSEARKHGFQKYFTGKPCLHGHISERLTSSSTCCTCAKNRSKSWALNNREKINKRTAQLRSENPDIFHKYEKSYRDRNTEIIRERMRLWTENNREKVRNRLKDRKTKNRKQFNAYERNRRARKANADGIHTAEDIARIREAQRDRCANPACRVKLKGKGHVDHIQPLARGGSNWPRNLQLLCEPCNCSKNDKDPFEFYRSSGLLL